MEVREDNEEVNPKDSYNLNQGDVGELKKAGVTQKPRKGLDTGTEATERGDWGSCEALNLISNVPGLRLQSDILRSPADCGNRHADLVWKLKWKTVIIQALSAKHSLRMLLKGTSWRTPGAGGEQGGGEGATRPARATSRLYLSDL